MHLTYTYIYNKPAGGWIIPNNGSLHTNVFEQMHHLHVEVPNVYISETSFAMCLNVLLYENKLNSLEISLLGHFNWLSCWINVYC